ncbi:helix-hairpin-helix domain-containing protein [Paenibacillus sp. J22TS3]|uniref:ComEA family DNA-binding protein n=1 Tax=Paenibacillus sp. J22TS3 TaxID=2807192 RepID=UPI001B1B160B|nr:helix-hairpin-helix domain-containing protein [Paenibacillus sp. J22TS3]GIP20573.1 hypothetical protein J22TS3_08480 [Paenibacillus sp. J22TS3]
MVRKTLVTAVVSAIAGAGLMLFAVGGRGPSGLDGWVPVNPQVAEALDSKESSERNRIAEERPKTSSENIRSGKSSKGEEAAGGAGPISRPGESSSEKKAEERNTGKSVEEAPSGKLISINKADLAGLQNIPGIGAKKAAAIVEYRDKHGDFKKVSDLTQVKGIGPKMLEKMKPYIEL